MSKLVEAMNEVQEAILQAIDASEEDIILWDACSEDGVPEAAEDRHSRLKLALALLLPVDHSARVENPPKALRLFDIWDQMPTDRDGANGPKGLARQAFIAAKIAALA